MKRSGYDLKGVALGMILEDMEKWIRGLPSHAGARADQNSIRLSPVPGVNITFDRYVMTTEGFISRQEFRERKRQNRMEMFKELGEQGKLFVMEVRGGQE